MHSRIESFRVWTLDFKLGLGLGLWQLSQQHFSSSQHYFRAGAMQNWEESTTSDSEKLWYFSWAIKEFLEAMLGVFITFVFSSVRNHLINVTLQRIKRPFIKLTQLKPNIKGLVIVMVNYKLSQSMLAFCFHFTF